MDAYSDKRFDVHDEKSIDRECLEAIAYNYPGRDTEVEYYTDEFTSVCPWTGLPDHGILSITYVPNEHLVELKSLKYYLLSYRNVGILQEHAVNSILDDLVAVIKPKWMKVSGDFSLRGGIGTRAAAEYDQDGCQKEAGREC